MTNQQMFDLFAEAFTLWNSPVTWLELVAVVLALAMVGCNMREIHWGWPLAIVSSLMYFALFWRNRLYGDATLQIVFATLGGWGWFQWLRGRRPDGTALRVVRLGPRGVGLAIVASLVLWAGIGLVLKTFTNSDVAWPDAFVTAVSLVGQVLLARKYLENWAAWLAVNVVSVVLLAHKALWLTAGFYLVLVVLSVAGWRAWKARL